MLTTQIGNFFKRYGAASNSNDRHFGILLTALAWVTFYADYLLSDRKSKKRSIPKRYDSEESYLIKYRNWVSGAVVRFSSFCKTQLRG